MNNRVRDYNNPGIKLLGHLMPVYPL